MKVCCEEVFANSFQATSALDAESEQLVQCALTDLVSARKRTTIIIAHRLSTIRNADKIVLIENGKMIESGSHQELMSNNGPYHTFIKNQLV